MNKWASRRAGRRARLARRPWSIAAALEPFRIGGRLYGPLVALYLGINGIVLANALLHHPAIGYDALDHLRYVRVLARFRLPTPAETREFFSPPLAYLLPALLDASELLSFPAVAKTAQLLNVGLSGLLTFGLLRLCDLVRPGSRFLKPVALGLLGMLPVYYKTFAFVRPEPLLACLAVWSTHGILRVLAWGECTPRAATTLGVVLGLLLLTRQQAVLWVAATMLVVLLALRAPSAGRGRIIRAAAVALAIAAGVGGWFYLHLTRVHGSPAAFNRPRESFSLANRPRSFYLGLGDGALFRDPIRPSFRLQLWPKLYAETWGDHESYFLVYGRDRRRGELLSGGLLERALARGVPPWLETNRYGIAGYLGRVNLLALLPSTLLLGGLGLGLHRVARILLGGRAGKSEQAEAALALLAAASVVGYLVLLVVVPTESGDTVKATYLLHVLPLAAVLAGAAWEALHRRWRAAGVALLVALGAVAAHNLGALVTRYPPPGG